MAPVNWDPGDTAAIVSGLSAAVSRGGMSVGRRATTYSVTAPGGQESDSLPAWWLGPARSADKRCVGAPYVSSREGIVHLARYVSSQHNMSARFFSLQNGTTCSHISCHEDIPCPYKPPYRPLSLPLFLPLPLSLFPPLYLFLPLPVSLTPPPFLPIPFSLSPLDLSRPTRILIGLLKSQSVSWNLNRTIEISSAKVILGLF